MSNKDEPQKVIDSILPTYADKMEESLYTLDDTTMTKVLNIAGCFARNTFFREIISTNEENLALMAKLINIYFVTPYTKHDDCPYSSKFAEHIIKSEFPGIAILKFAKIGVVIDEPLMQQVFDERPDFAKRHIVDQLVKDLSQHKIHLEAISKAKETPLSRANMLFLEQYNKLMDSLGYPNPTIGDFLEEHPDFADVLAQYADTHKGQDDIYKMSVRLGLPIPKATDDATAPATSDTRGASAFELSELDLHQSTAIGQTNEQI
jgi:hypothetical protein